MPAVADSFRQSLTISGCQPMKDTKMAETHRIAMWSGPRNISTAMMRAWENRTDTWVWDEPLYACYLHCTGIDHPGRDEIIAAGETDWRKVVARCVTASHPERPVFFQKHMTHHLLNHISRDWLAQVVNCFLIRDPREVVASYARVRGSPTAADVGVLQQGEMVDEIKALTGRTPVIVDARDVLEAPGPMLKRLCQTLGIEWQSRMLEWPEGARSSDGVWAKHWYHSVQSSRRFSSYRTPTLRLSAPLEALAEQCMATYQRLHAERLTA